MHFWIMKFRTSMHTLVTPQKKILSSFTYPNVIPNRCNICLSSVEHNSRFFWKMPFFLSIFRTKRESSFVFHRRQKFKQVRNGRVNEDRTVNYPFNLYMQSHSNKSTLPPTNSVFSLLSVADCLVLWAWCWWWSFGTLLIFADRLREVG